MPSAPSGAMTGGCIMDTNTILTIVIAVVGLAVALFALNRSRS